MRRPRFRLRTLLIAVAIAGLLCGGMVEANRLDHLAWSSRERAAFHANRQDLALQGVDLMQALCDELDGERGHEIPKAAPPNRDRTFAAVIHAFPCITDDWREGMQDASDAKRMYARCASRLARKADYCRRMRLKYERAARYPWLPVPPDPPMPPDPPEPE